MNVILFTPSSSLLLLIIVIIFTIASSSSSSSPLPSPSTTRHLIDKKLLSSSKPKVSSYTSNALTCKLPKVCSFFKNTLLVIKLNPVRLLWIDKLLKFYSHGFENIVFYAPRRKDEEKSVSSTTAQNNITDFVQGKKRVVEFLRVGKYNTLVHLIDENYGFCDHETVASAVELYEDHFDGFFFLSDDVLVQYWRFAAEAGDENNNKNNNEFDLKKFWRQKKTKGKIARTPNHRDAADETLELFPDLASFLSQVEKNPPFAATSGIWYLPAFRNTIVGKTDKNRFITISAILNKHRTYNEWGTPFLLECVSFGSYTPIRGKLVWGSKRHFVVKIPQEQYLWFHPVRVSSEFFSRVEDELEEKKRNAEESDAEKENQNSQLIITTSKESFESKVLSWKIDHTIFQSNRCLDCATYPMKQRQMKSLLHSCELVQDERDNLQDSSVFAVNTCMSAKSVAAVKKLWPIMGADHVAPYLTGFRFRVRKERDQIPSEFELEHEGFWNEKVVNEVFGELYVRFFANRSSLMGVRYNYNN